MSGKNMPEVFNIVVFSWFSIHSSRRTSLHHTLWRIFCSFALWCHTLQCEAKWLWRETCGWWFFGWIASTAFVVMPSDWKARKIVRTGLNWLRKEWSDVVSEWRWRNCIHRCGCYLPYSL